MKTTQEVLSDLQSDNTKHITPSDNSILFDDDYFQGKAMENRQKPGNMVFIREDGKIGFPTTNSIPIKIGDIAKGKIVLEADSYFMVQIREKEAQED